MKLIIINCIVFTSLSAFANDLDCKLLKGTAIGAKAIVVDTKGTGNIHYHIRTFELLRNSGNNLSALIKKELVNELSSDKLKRAVLRVAISIDNSIQNGQGDAYYWAKLSSVKLQDLQNATDNLYDLAEITCH